MFSEINSADEITAFRAQIAEDRAARSLQPIGEHDLTSGNMDWTDSTGTPMPPGSDRKFGSGSFQGTTFCDLAFDHPGQFFVMRASKTKSIDWKDYVKWVED